MLKPGSTIGILGGGQLGRMTLLAGRDMGYRFHIYEPSKGNCAGVLADKDINTSYDDAAAIDAFAEGVDVVTLEFENIPADTLRHLESKVAVHPGPNVLSVCQNRQREKTFLKEKGIPCAPFAIVESVEDLKKAVEDLGLPAVLKTADFGYDGKGQFKLESIDQIQTAWDNLDAPVGVLEKWVQFQGEYSVICARNSSGDCKLFPIAENIHTNHILDFSIVPARLDKSKFKEAEELAISIADELNVIGLIAVELFYSEECKWIVNEMAPRPHNSGHYTMDACYTSQFEQHVRAVCNLPLGNTDIIKPVVMVNILGDSWKNGEPVWEEIFKDPMTKLHLYDKGEPRVGRKMGHFTVMDDDVNVAFEKAEKIKKLLAGD